MSKADARKLALHYIDRIDEHRARNERARYDERTDLVVGTKKLEPLVRWVEAQTRD